MSSARSTSSGKVSSERARTHKSCTTSRPGARFCARARFCPDTVSVRGRLTGGALIRSQRTKVATATGEWGRLRLARGGEEDVASDLASDTRDNEQDDDNEESKASDQRRGNPVHDLVRAVRVAFTGTCTLETRCSPNDWATRRLEKASEQPLV